MTVNTLAADRLITRVVPADFVATSCQMRYTSVMMKVQPMMAGLSSRYRRLYPAGKILLTAPDDATVRCHLSGTLCLSL